MIKFVKTAISCAIFILGSITSYAQMDLQNNKYDPFYRLPSNIVSMNDGNYIPGVNGSSFLSDEWAKGRITMNDGTIVDTIDLRLNVYKNAMHYRYKGVEYAIGTPEKIKEITMGSRKFIYYPYKKGKEIAHAYFEVLVEGKAELLVLFYITRFKANYNVAYNIGDKNDHLRLDERYFANLGSSIVEIDKKGKSIFDGLGDKDDVLRKRIKEEDLSFKKKEDLVKIITYVNEIN